MSIYSIVSAAQWLGKLAPLALEEVKYLSEVSEKVETLQSELEWMQCFLLDADQKQNKSVLIRKWVLEISNLALDAEDLTQTYLRKVLRREQDGVIDKLNRVACFGKDVKILHKLGGKIDRLTIRISKISLRLQTYGVRISHDEELSQAATKKWLAQRRTYAHTQPGNVFGLEHDTGKLTEELHDGQHKILVAYGMGGIGKTSLAREVYHNCLSQGNFVGCAWAYISQQCNLEAVCKEVLYGLIPKNDMPKRESLEKLEASELPGKLCEMLCENKYLVVLDDVWDLETWKLIEPAFPIHDSSCRSKLLVTTRNLQTFSNFSNDLVFAWKAETLKEDSCWKLLESKAHFKRNDLDSSKKAVAQKMLDHCNGHPLAIIVLGGVLETKKLPEEWESVSENLQFYLQGDGESYSGVYEVLEMSYNDLQYNLKPGFLHMGHFPEDARIDVEKLYSLWIANGIILSNSDNFGTNRSLEEIADNYLNQLILKGIIQVDGKDAEGRIKTVSLHDLMRDKCLEMTRKEKFLQIVRTHEENNYIADGWAKRVRRVTVYVGYHGYEKHILDSLSGKFPSLRSLIFISTCANSHRKEADCKWIKIICKRFKLLRILDFEGGVILQGPLPREVGNLIYLTSLCLKGTRVTELPSSIRNLKCLMVLDLRVRGVVIMLPNVLWEMKSLNCVYFPVRELSQEGLYSIQKYKIKGGSSLILDKLAYLESVLNVDLDRVDVKGFLGLTGMRKLSATCRRQETDLLPFLESQSIKHLHLKIDAGLLTGDSSMLLSESKSLEILHIDAKRSEPIYMSIRVDMFPCNLVKLGFWYCKLVEDPMPVLESLRKLKSLELHLCYERPEINCSEKAFPELTYLELDGLFSLKTWNVQKGGFPKLLELEIYNCRLEKIPDVLPPSIHIKSTPGLQPKVDQFRLQSKGS